MVNQNRRLLKNIFWFFLLIPVLTACTRQASSAVFPTPTGAYEISPLLADFYHDIGGEELFGPPISNLFTREGMSCQYTLNALLCQNPDETDVHKSHFLWPIGKDLNPEEGSAENQPTGNVEISPDFFPLYQNLGGPAILGFPLGNPINNYDKQRVEQVFERVAFFRNFDEPTGTAHLLPLGKMDCGETCTSIEDNRTNHHIDASNPQSFSEPLGPYGGTAIFGQALTEPYPTAAGELEQVFENIVVFSDGSGQVHFRPITRLLNMIAAPPVAFDAEKGNVTFYETGDGLGYHVPVVFEQFISNHGGYDLSGPPIADTLQYSEENVIRQCFENYCLDYFPNDEESEKIRLAPLGAKYLNAVNTTTVTQNPSEPKEVDLILSEEHPDLPPNQTQRIYIMVFEKGTQQGVAGVTASVTLTINQSPLQFTTPPTNQNGWTNISIPPIPDVQNSMVIPYEVCLNNISPQPVCKQDSYLIWEAR